LAFNDDVAKLAGSVAGRREQAHIEAAKRLLTLVQGSVALASKECEHKPAFTEELAKVHAQLDSSADFLAAHRPDWGATMAGPRSVAVAIEVGHFEGAVDHARQVCNRCLARLALALKGQRLSLMEHAPPASLLLNPKICVDEALQKSLFDNPDKKELGNDVATLSSYLRCWATLREHGVQVDKEEFYQAEIARNHGKLAVGVEYALRKIILERPDRVEDLPAHASRVQDRVRGKGVKLPPYIVSLLNGMQSRMSAGEQTT